MGPLLFQMLDARGLAGWSWLLPTPGAVYAILAVTLGCAFLIRSGRTSLGRTRSLEIVLSAAMGAALGARLFFLITTGQLASSDVLSLLDTSRGTASWGAYLGALGGMLCYARCRRIDPRPILDVAASVAGLSEVLGRWACWLAGDDFGTVTAVPWAIHFPSGSLAWHAHIVRGAILPDAASSLPVHPLQFYLMANALAVFLVVSAVWRRSASRPGLTTGAFFAVHGATRFWWEFLRDPSAGGAGRGLSVSQWTCVGFVAAGLGIVIITRNRAIVTPRLGRVSRGTATRAPQQTVAPRRSSALRRAS